MEQILSCSKQNHQNNPLNLICINPQCTQKGFICSYCLIENHHSHVKSCYPQKNILKCLNEMNNLKVKEDLNDIKCEILKQHSHLTSQFKRYIKNLKDSIEQIEKSIEQKMQELKNLSDLFIGNKLEQYLVKINSMKGGSQEMQEDIFKLLPLINMKEDGQIECIGIEQKKLEAAKLNKKAEILEREIKYWMEKQIEDLHKLEQNIQIIFRKQFEQKKSQIRFGESDLGWCFNQTEGIAFQSLKKQDIWMNGIGIYKVLNCNDENVCFDVKITKGENPNENILFQENIRIKASDFEQSTEDILKYSFSHAIKIETKEQYSIFMSPLKEYMCYYGINGCQQTSEFIFKDVKQLANLKSSTKVIYGQFPLFLFDE